MNALQEQETQDYREDAPVLPLPEPPAGPSDRELFRVGFKSWAVARWVASKTWWKDEWPKHLRMIRPASLFFVLMLGLCEFLNLFIGGLPGLAHYLLATALAVAFHWLGVLVYEGAIDEGRKVLGLEKD